MIDWSKASAELSKKLDPANVKPAKSFGPKGDYIEGWLAIQEANRIFGFNGWHYTIPECTCVFQGPREIGQAKKPGFGVTYTAKVAVMVGGVIREDFGAGHGYDVDCGLAHESAIKEAVTDALKRALRSFGNPFGLALYDKSRENVGVDEPRATDAEVTAAMDAANACADIAALKAWWTGLTRGAPHVAAEADVIAAKDARKAQLTERKEAA
jgi:DNA repair and recombination protein RAD52